MASTFASTRYVLSYARLKDTPYDSTETPEMRFGGIENRQLTAAIQYTD